MSLNPTHESLFKEWLRDHRGIIFKVTWAINRSCAKRTIEPRLAELERLREHLIPRN